jgi:DNA repair protein SbcD/Mre11
MTGFKFLHAADLHIDSPMLGLERYPEAPHARLRSATRQAFENLVRLALDEQASFVVLAGDLFDESWRDYHTGVFFCGQLARLERAGIRVFLIHGNHDAAGDMARRLRWPSNTIALDHASPQTVRLDALGVALHGQSFHKREVTSNLAADYPAAVPGFFNLGLLHTSLTGRDGHAAYAPCSLQDLLAKGYDYWALGHVHRREVVAQAPAHVVFPGNLQGRNVRETGPRGCSVVTVQSGKVTEVRHEPLDVVRWAIVELDVSALATAEEVIEHLADEVAAEVGRADGRLLAVRVRATGATAAAGMRAYPDRWRSELIVRLLSLAPDRVWLEKLELDLRAPTAEPEEGGESLATLERLFAELATSTEQRPTFVTELERKVGAELSREGGEPLFGPQSLAELREDGLELLRGLLRGKGDRA